MKHILTSIGLILFFFIILIVLQSQTGSGDVSDFLKPMFSAATFSLFIIAAAIGALTLVLTVYGRDWLEREIDRRVEKRVAAESRDMYAYITAQVGFIFGKLYQEHKGEFPELLDNAINYTSRAYSMLSYEHFAQPGLRNNYAFLAALSGSPEYAYVAVDAAKSLREEEYRKMDIEDMLTYIQIVKSYARYFENPDHARSDAKEISIQITTRADATESQKQRAQERISGL